MPNPELHRILGGSPFSVIVRILVISLIVGAAMVYFNLTPHDLLDKLRRVFESILGSGLENLRTIVLYIGYGAIVVVPIFIIVRLLRLTRRS